MNKNEINNEDNNIARPKNFSNLIYATFFWCMIGVSLIYGIRLWLDTPIHPSFLPLVGAVFAAILAFTLVMSLSHVVGPIVLKSNLFEFSGASGPIILWCICFLVIVYGLYLMGMPDTIKSGYEKELYSPCSIGERIRDECPNKPIQPTLKNDAANS